MRIGAVSYLNTKPLIYGLAQLAPQHELVLDVPSRLADDLAAGRLDVALIPSVEYFQNPNYAIVSDACIACQGPVRSVKLFSRVPLAAIRTLALDEGSRTSIALVQILLRERLGISPRLMPFPMSAAAESIDADALLMIGDRAMRPPLGPLAAQWDLGEEWRRWSGLPFVFAMWVARRENGQAGWADAGDTIRHGDEDLNELAVILGRSRDSGVAHVESIAAAEHGAAGLTCDDCLTYLRDHLHFYLGAAERAGLRLFREHAARLGLAPDDIAEKEIVQKSEVGYASA